MLKALNLIIKVELFLTLGQSQRSNFCFKENTGSQLWILLVKGIMPTVFLVGHNSLCLPLKPGTSIAFKWEHYCKWPPVTIWLFAIETSPRYTQKYKILRRNKDVDYPHEYFHARQQEWKILVFDNSVKTEKHRNPTTTGMDKQAQLRPALHKSPAWLLLKETYCYWLLLQLNDAYFYSLQKQPLKELTDEIIKKLTLLCNYSEKRIWVLDNSRLQLQSGRVASTAQQPRGDEYFENVRYFYWKKESSIGRSRTAPGCHPRLMNSCCGAGQLLGPRFGSRAPVSFVVARDSGAAPTSCSQPLPAASSPGEPWRSA